LIILKYLLTLTLNVATASEQIPKQAISLYEIKYYPEFECKSNKHISICGDNEKGRYHRLDQFVIKCLGDTGRANLTIHSKNIRQEI